MSKYRINFGRSSEEKAISYLKGRGYRILEANYRNKLGEIDIIARHEGRVCFIEVKSRASLDFGLPKEAVDSRKQNKISQAALFYLKRKNLLDEGCRFDVLSILDNGEGSQQFELIQGAFDLAQNYSY
jgi:putative endonuclease